MHDFLARWEKVIVIYLGIGCLMGHGLIRVLVRNAHEQRKTEHPLVYIGVFTSVTLYWLPVLCFTMYLIVTGLIAIMVNLTINYLTSWIRRGS